jgi:ribosomal protein S18 acetylase RimI-like enzyme
MPNEITIKNAPIEDVVEVNSTIVEFDAPYDKKYFEDRIADKDKLITVAYINDKPIGYVVWYDRDGDDSFYCWMAGVNPEYRRLGALKKLMDFSFDWAKNKGYKKIKIKTRNNRREMLAYLVRYGFWFSNVIQYPDIRDYRIELEKST